MKVKVQKSSSSDLIFFSAYFIYLVVTLLRTSFYCKYFEGNIYTAIKVLCIFLLIVNEIVKSKLTLKLLSGLFVCFSIYMIVAYNTSFFSDVVMLLAFVYCGHNLSFEKIAKLTIYVSSIILVFVVLSSYAGIINNYIEIVQTRRREYLGFRYSLYPAAIIFNITALILYLNRRKIKLWHVLLLGASNFFIFYKTNSRLSFYMAVVMIVMIPFFQRFPKILQNSKMLHIGMGMSFIIAAASSYVLTVKYNSSIEWMNTLNNIFNNRLKYGNRSLVMYGVSLLGKHNMEWVGNGLDSAGNKSTQTYLWVDNFYISILQRFGILVSIIIILLLTFTLFKCWKNQNYYLMFMLTLMAGHCMVDDLFLYLNYNTFWFVIGATLMTGKMTSKIRIPYKKQKFIKTLPH